MELDGNALVYGGQKGAGASAWNNPSLQIGNTPLDHEAARLHQENIIRQQQEQIAAQQKEKEKAAAFKPFENLPLSKWDNANRQQLGKALIGVKNRMAQLRTDGVIPNDYNNPKSREYDDLLVSYQNMVGEADAQKQVYDNAQKALFADFDNPEDKQVFDRDKSIANLTAYYNSPDIDERRKIDPNSLLVRKAPKFTTYDPVKNLDVNKFGEEVGNNGLTGGYTKTILNADGLKTKIEGDLLTGGKVNDANKAHYDWGVTEGLWNSPKEYVKVQTDYLKPQLNENKKTFQKEPKTTIIDINNGNSEELIGKLGGGTQTMKVPLFDVNDKKTSKSQTVNLDNVVQLDNINSTVNWATAINPATGQHYSDSGTFDLTSGAMALPLVKKGTDRILPTDKGTYTYKKDGKETTITGDQKSIEKQLVEAGVAEYKPMIFGTSKETINGKTVSKEVWLPADAATLGTNDKNKALNAAQQAYEIYKKRAKDLNTVAPTATKATPKSYKQKYKDASGKAVYTLDGTTYWYEDGTEYTP